jgi:hypothetical protein
LVGLLAQGMAFLHDADVELELLLALVLPALEPAAEDLQEGGASSEGGQAGDDAVHRGDGTRAAPDRAACKRTPASLRYRSRVLA